MLLLLLVVEQICCCQSRARHYCINILLSSSRVPIPQSNPLIVARLELRYQNKCMIFIYRQTARLHVNKVPRANGAAETRLSFRDRPVEPEDHFKPPSWGNQTKDRIFFSRKRKVSGERHKGSCRIPISTSKGQSYDVGFCENVTPTPWAL
jgi:hypothetical protein